MVPTTEEALETLFVDAIVGMTPRLQYKGAVEWKPYERGVKGSSRTRRFRIVFDRVRLRGGGAMAGSAFEHTARMRVVTDYAGDRSDLQHVINDDGLQLRDVLSALKASDNGVMLVEPYDEDRPWVERFTFDEDADVTQVEHIFKVHYMRSIAP